MAHDPHAQRRRQSIQYFALFEGRLAIVEILIVAADANCQIPWKLSPSHVFLDGVHFLLAERSLPIQGGDERADRREHISEHQGANKEGKKRVEALDVILWYDIAVANLHSKSATATE